jgi:uncharacterized tellurite resistance protein B-like protein
MVKPMSLNEELNKFFSESKKVVVREPLKFKASLGIGDRAYRRLRTREHMTTFTEVVGIATTAVGLARSGWIATTFFASKGFTASTLSAFGLGATAVTPVGWVIAAVVVSSTAYVGVTHLLERSKDNGLIVVPKYINTPLDIIAVALIELMLPVSLKIAHADGSMHESENRAIHDFYTDEWGYCSEFITRLIAEYQDQLDSVSYSTIADSLAAYCAGSKDCDKEAIMAAFMAHLRHVIEADGVIHESERAEINYLSDILIKKSEKAGGSVSVSNAIRAASQGLTYSTAAISESGKSIWRRIFARSQTPDQS